MIPIDLYGKATFNPKGNKRLTPKIITYFFSKLYVFRNKKLNHAQVAVMFANGSPNHITRKN